MKMQNQKEAIKRIKKSLINYRTESLVFRPFVKADCYPLYQASLHPDFNKYLNWGTFAQEQDLIIEMLKLMREDDRNETAFFSICEKDTGKWVGVKKFSIYEDSLVQAIWTHPDYWNSIIPLRASYAAMSIAFEIGQIQHLYGFVRKENPIMAKIVTRNNFKLIKEDVFTSLQNEKIGVHIYKLNREDWESRIDLIDY